jgi:hypothetical protein
LTDPLVTHLERIRDLADDLAREVSRRHADPDTALDVADAIRRDIDAVIRILGRRG